MNWHGFPKNRKKTPLMTLFFVLSLIGLIAAAPLFRAVVEVVKSFSSLDVARILFGLGLLCLGQFFAQQTTSK